MKNRSGGYKKVLFSTQELALVGEKLEASLSDLLCLDLVDYDQCTLYILLFLRLRHEKNWLQQKCPLPFEIEGAKLLEIIPDSFNLSEWEKRKLENVTTKTLFSHFNLRGIPGGINRAMTNWSSGLWNIVLLDYIPSSKKLLGFQAHNKRCVTIITKKDQINKLVLEARDPLSFVLHDLDHADHFFSNREILHGQLGFYKKTLEIYDLPLLENHRRENASFEHDFNYVVSDMNAYVVHLAKCLKAAFTNHQLSGFQEILQHWKCSPLEEETFSRLNTPCFTSVDETIIKNFFESTAHLKD